MVFVSDSGSSSSGSASGGNSGSEKSSNAGRLHFSDGGKSSPKDSHANSSKSDHHTDKDSSDDSIRHKSRNNHDKIKSDIWEDNPDIYGVRRSARSRKEPDRLKLADSDSSDKGRNNGRRNRKKR